MERKMYFVKYKEPLANAEIVCTYIAANVHQVHRYIEEYLHGELVDLSLKGSCICIMDNMFPPQEMDADNYIWTKIPKSKE